MVQGGLTRGLTHSDIVNDDSKTAWVRVEGTVNQQPFVVRRSGTRSGNLSAVAAVLHWGSAVTALAAHQSWWIKPTIESGRRRIAMEDQPSDACHCLSFFLCL